MIANTDTAIRNKALLYTSVIMLGILLLLYLLKWKLPEFEKEPPTPTLDVEVNWPPDPPSPFIDGGGGGGNMAAAFNEAGSTISTPPISGEQANSKESEVDPTNNHSEAPISNINKSKILSTSGLRIKPQKNIESPMPAKPKAVMGKSSAGNGSGANTIDEFERTGGKGNGLGAGNGNGEGGGRGEGIGGGNGNGIGLGSGPRVTKGDRRIVKTYSFEGDLNRATLYVNILVSPEGTGKFISFAKGSTTTSTPYRQAIIQYLEKMRFDAADHESTITVQFNFRIN